MTAIRRKIDTAPLPATTEEAEGRLRRYADLLVETNQARASAEALMEQIKTLCEEGLAAVDAEMAALFTELHSWWLSGKEAATGGARKSLILGGMHIGERTTPPALALAEGQSDDDVIEAMLALPGRDKSWLVTRHALARPALIKALRAGEASRDHLVLAKGLGLRLSQREEFFIDSPPLAAIPVNAEVCQ